jgi:LuxR family maltose regulon positive regulatory protein
LAQNTPDSRDKAADLVNRIQEFYENTHNTRFLIETLALKALLQEASGDPSAALETLAKTLRLAQPGGFIRLFVDMGPVMARLLPQLKVEDDLRDYVGQIRSAFPLLQGTQQAMKQGDLLDPLTDRELEILELLYKRLSNKEIAAQLVISPGTVKGHTIKIYQKLDVNGRRQAVEKAVELGLLIPA